MLGALCSEKGAGRWPSINAFNAKVAKGRKGKQNNGLSDENTRHLRMSLRLLRRLEVTLGNGRPNLRIEQWMYGQSRPGAITLRP